MLASAIASSVARVDLLDAFLDAADLQGRKAALVVGRDGHRSQHGVDLLLAENSTSAQPLAGASRDQLLRARAGGHAGRRDADDAPRAVLGGDRTAVERVDLLRADARHRRRLVLRVAGRDRDLGAGGALAFANELGDVLGERLGAERRLAEDDLADRLVDDLVETRHVRALLVAGEVDEAVQAREEELLANPDDLLDARHADAREADGTPGGRACTSSPEPSEGETKSWYRCPASSLAYRGRARQPARRPRGPPSPRLTAADSGITPHLVWKRASRGPGTGAHREGCRGTRRESPFELKAQEASSGEVASVGATEGSPLGVTVSEKLEG